MKKILIHLSFFVVLLLIGLFLYFAFFLNGKADQFYPKIIGNKYNSLVIGSSRAGQGIIPSIFNKSNLQFDREMYNFSFTIDHSRFGDIYLNAVKKKIKTDRTNGLFIIEVNPLMLSRSSSNVDDNPNKFKEKKYFISKLKSFSATPNIEYLTKYLNTPYIRIIIYNVLSKFNIHSDGWTEISVPMDSATIVFRKNIKFRKYKTRFESNMFSENRFSIFQNTIDYLKQYGKVVLVRLPIDKTLYDMENEFMPDFDDKVENVAKQKDVMYLNFTDSLSNYTTTDGNHLYKVSAQIVTRQIINYLQQN